MAETKPRNKFKYQKFQRYWGILVMLNLVVALVGSAAQGAPIATVLFRGLIVMTVLLFVGKILVVCWELWGMVQEEAKKAG